MSTVTDVNHGQRVAELQAEVAGLEGAIAEARLSVEHAQQRLVELSRAMDALAPDVYAGDSAASLDYAALSEEVDQFERQARIARVTLDKRTAQLKARKEELKEAKRHLAESRYTELGAEIEEAQQAAREAAFALRDRYRDLRRLHGLRVQQAQLFMDDNGQQSVAMFGPQDSVRPAILRALRNAGLPV